MTGRRGWLTALTALAAGLATLAAGCAGPSAHPGAGPGPSSTGTATPSAPPASPSPASPANPAPTPPGPPSVIPVPRPPARLHQTRALPRAHTAVFRAEMTDLWTALVTGRFRPGVLAFFPLTAYQQVKAIADPSADWHSRLLADFRLDVAAAHHFLRQAPGRPHLVRV